MERALKHADRPLVAAARRGDLAAVLSLLARETPPDLDACDDAGLSALAWAAGGGHEQVARALLAAGAKVNAPHAEAQPPLYQSLTKGHVAVASLLLGARPPRRAAARAPP